MARPQIALLLRQSVREKILHPDDLEVLRGFADVKINAEDRDLDEEEAADFLVGMDGVMATWTGRGVRMQLSPAVVEKVPSLKIWSHAAGTVKTKICEEAYEKGIVVTSAAPAIADDVAEYTMAFITIGLRRVIQRSRQMAANEKPEKSVVKTLYRRTVGVISASHVGQRVMKLLQPYRVRLLLYDPFVSEEQAKEFGAELLDLETMARECDVVTCHAPRLDATHHMWNRTHFKLMKDDTVFVNTSRGPNIDQAALIEELQKGRLFALLDVTDPEPAEPDSPLRTLPNVVLTPHIAGPQTYRVGGMAAEELRRYFAGEGQIHQVTHDMLETIA